MKHKEKIKKNKINGEARCVRVWRSVVKNDGRAKRTDILLRFMSAFSVIFRHNLHELNSAMLFNKR